MKLIFSLLLIVFLGAMHSAYCWDYDEWGNVVDLGLNEYAQNGDWGNIKKLNESLQEHGLFACSRAVQLAVEQLKLEAAKESKIIRGEDVSDDARVDDYLLTLAALGCSQEEIQRYSREAGL